MDTKLSSDQFDLVSVIKKSAESLVALINSILDHSKIESGKLTLDVSDFDFSKLMHETITMFRFAASEKNLDLKLKLHGEDHSWFVRGDNNRVRQIFVNLIGNALKFTSRGGIVVEVKKSESSDGKIRFHCEVKDTGPGMSKVDSSKLFKRYSQTESGVKMGGAGLGLFISQQLAEMMKGEIGVKSELGIGSTFWFEIVLDQAQSCPIDLPTVDSVSEVFGGQVLVVEDQVVNQRVVLSYLAKLGVRADVAENGQKALEMFEKNNYDLIFMDCRMPIMDGYTATKNIREIEKKNNKKYTPIVALSAEGASGDRRKSVEVGMDDFLTKPIDLDKLVVVLRERLSASGLVLDHMALQQLEGLTVKGQDLLTVLVADFSVAAPKALVDMRDAIRNNNVTLLSDLAHGLKSTCATLGARRAAEICQELEDAKAIDQTHREMVTALEAEIGKAKGELEKELESKAS